jgi:hypothetical protein
VSTIAIALAVFVCCFAAALAGLCVKLPAHRIDADSKETVRLVMGLIATMAALVLGLLIASASSSYNTQAAELQQMSADLTQLDRMLVLYGPETGDIREMLRQTVSLAHQRIWPPETGRPPNLDPSIARGRLDLFFAKLENLTPKGDAQARAQNTAWQLAASLTQLRMLMYEQLNGSVPRTLLVVLMFWVSVLFLSFGLFARFHVTLILVLGIGAISVAGAILLILELNQPYSGLIRLSDAPIVSALAAMDR